jgi:phage shock protein PspC (stress-responsive transcriptional regulator)
MKKTFTINISGLIFHINDDAFEKLNHYLATISGYFKGTTGHEEIISDIEARIAEMFKAKITANKQVITMEDVDEVIAVMGKPEDFLDEGLATEAVPPYERSTTTRKRLFRDVDERVLGGVCAGLTAYFGINDTIWIRLAFVASVFLGIGSGLIIYIILWIIMPPARTAAEKLEMKGEPVNISNLHKVFNEEAEAVKKKFNDFSKENIDSTGMNRKARTVGNKFINFLLDVTGLVLTALGKFIGLILLVIGTVLLIAFIGLMFSHNIVFWYNDEFMASFNDWALFFFQNERQIYMGWLGILLIVGIPIIGLFIAGLKLILGIRKRFRVAGSILSAFWLIGLIISGYIAFEVSRDFRNKAFTETIVIPEQPQSDTLYLKMTDHDKPAVHFGNTKFFMDNEQLLISYPRIKVEASETEEYQIMLKHRSFGGNSDEAILNSKRIGYNYSQSGSTITLDPYFRVDREDKFRGQKLYLIIKVPEGKYIFLDESLQKGITDTDNLNNKRARSMVGHTWRMSPKGLECLSC